MSQKKYARIIALKNAGRSMRSIAIECKHDYKTVWSICKKYDAEKLNETT